VRISTDCVGATELLNNLTAEVIVQDGTTWTVPHVDVWSVNGFEFLKPEQCRSSWFQYGFCGKGILSSMK
jgi:hypothetical protein